MCYLRNLCPTYFHSNMDTLTGSKPFWMVPPLSPNSISETATVYGFYWCKWGRVVGQDVGKMKKKIATQLLYIVFCTLQRSLASHCMPTKSDSKKGTFFLTPPTNLQVIKRLKSGDISKYFLCWLHFHRKPDRITCPLLCTPNTSAFVCCRYQSQFRIGCIIQKNIVS